MSALTAAQNDSEPKLLTLTIATKSPFAYQIKNCLDLLDTKCDVLRLVGYGHSIPRCIALVAEIQNILGESVSIKAVTYSDTFGQDIDAESYEQSAVSGVAFRVARKPILVA